MIQIQETVEEMSRAFHGKSLLYVSRALLNYADEHPGVEIFSETDTYLFEGDSKLIPDIAVVGADRAVIFANDDDVIKGAPHIIVEAVSPSSYLTDSGIKADRYASAGVLEYWVIVPELELMVAYENISGTFESFALCGIRDTFRSKYLEGFSLEMLSVLDWKRRRKKA